MMRDDVGRSTRRNVSRPRQANPSQESIKINSHARYTVDTLIGRQVCLSTVLEKMLDFAVPYLLLIR